MPSRDQPSPPATPARPIFDLEVLEFDVVRALLLDRLVTPLGRTAVADLAPLRDASGASAALAEVAAMAQSLAAGTEAPLAGAVEVRSWLAPCFRGEHQLQSRDLADLKRSLRAAERCRRWLLQSPSAALQARAAAMQDLEDLVHDLEQTVDDRGEVLRTASARLAQARQDIESARAAVENTVQRVLTDGDLRRYLQSPEPAWRHGRPVFQVRQEFRHKVPGVLHDRSQSGATLFVEPEAVVEVANRLSDATAAEHREIQVVLAQAARGLGRMRVEIAAGIEAVAALDLLVAKAKLVHGAGFVVPEIAADGTLCLRTARHPILLRERADQPVVPLDLTLGDPSRVLVVTGPNTGGKTVVIKTIGLLSLMAMAGVPVPAAPGTRFPFFSAVLADIGDEQGISQNLSTFSSHVVRIARCLQSHDTAGVRGPALVLLDELGAGTDPEEGSALGYAVLEELLRHGTFAIVTTHLGRLKEFAHQHAGAENGSMAFDGESLRPLFRLEVGIPGSSHALDIAGRVGMPEGIVGRARQLLGRRDSRLEEVIQKVQQTRRDAEEDRRRTEDLTRKAVADGRRVEEQLQENERRASWLHEEADALVEAQVRKLRSATAELVQDLQNAPGQHGERARALKGVIDHLLESVSVHRRRMLFCGSLRRGDTVFLPRFGRTAKVHKVDRVRETIVLDYGRMRMEVPFEDVSWLQPLEGGPS